MEKESKKHEKKESKKHEEREEKCGAKMKALKKLKK